MPNYRLTFEVDADGPVSSRRLSDLYREMHKYAETVLMPKGGELSSRYNATIIDFTELDGSNATFPVHQHDGGVENDYCAYCDSMSRDQRD